MTEPPGRLTWLIALVATVLLPAVLGYHGLALASGGGLLVLWWRLRG